MRKSEFGARVTACGVLSPRPFAADMPCPPPGQHVCADAWKDRAHPAAITTHAKHFAFICILLFLSPFWGSIACIPGTSKVRFLHGKSGDKRWDQDRRNESVSSGTTTAGVSTGVTIKSD
ncbi:hypothetical protein [Xanthomonas albilineans]|uniref:hypothetical protein n=1 Tax=Xanthomonas albilineans TaxID=29447 RepID=UPI001E5D7F54|nr:hypothetical protein [Xanthomonas albilineans]